MHLCVCVCAAPCFSLCVLRCRCAIPNGRSSPSRAVCVCVRAALQVRNTEWQIVVLDKLSYASKGYDRLRHTGVFHQIETYCAPIPPGLFYEMGAQVGGSLASLAVGWVSCVVVVVVVARRQSRSSSTP